MMEFIVLHIISLGLGIILDAVIGDPHFMPHPVRAIGRLITYLEKKLWCEKPDKARRRGALLWFMVEISVVAVTLIIMIAAYMISRYLGVFAEAVLTCYILAARSLCKESMAVCGCLQKNDISAARSALSMIVGRDTQDLDREEIINAAVETVAENTSDGVIAPLLYTVLGGPVLGMAYKGVNTMDSMLGYHNERYEHFGFFAAKADDVFNFIPSRISALFMVAASLILGIFSKIYSGKNAFVIWRRDRNCHTSPNSAQTESVCAGSLGIRLGGTHFYKGKEVKKPTIGDEKRKAVDADIKRANLLMYVTLALTLVFIFGIAAIIIVSGKS